jgi:hypothetical protein
MVGECVNSDRIRDTSPEGSIGKVPGEYLVSAPHRQDTVSSSPVPTLHRTISHSGRIYSRSFGHTHFRRSQLQVPYEANTGVRGRWSGSRSENGVLETTQAVRGLCDMRWNKTSRCRAVNRK